MKACIILNPASGADDENGGKALPYDPRVEVRRLKKPGDLEATVKAALDDGCDPIIAAGGDGTICGVAGCLVDTDRRLGLLPFGTFNYFARSLGVPEKTDEAMAVALDGEDCKLTVGEINGRLFLNNASLGAYAAILEVREGVYRRWGRSRIAAYWSVILAMISVYRPLTMKITVDGMEQHVRAPMAFVSVSPYQLEEMGLDGVDAIRSGKLALFIPRETLRLKLLWRAIRIFFRGARRGEDYTLITGREIVIETRRSDRLVARDGERERMAGPYVFRIREDALTVKVPRSEADAA